MTEHEPLKIVVLFTAVNFGMRRIVTKNKDDILFYTRDPKTIDRVSADILVTDIEVTNLERQIVRNSRVDTDKNIWSYFDLLDYLEAD